MGTKMGTKRVRSIRHVARPSRISEREKGFEPSTSTLARCVYTQKRRVIPFVQWVTSWSEFARFVPRFLLGGHEEGHEGISALASREIV